MIERRWKHLVVANPMSMSMTTVVMRMVPPILDDQLDMGPGVQQDLPSGEMVGGIWSTRPVMTVSTQMVPVEDRSCTDECRVVGHLVAVHTSFDADGHSLGVALVGVSNDGTVVVSMGAAITTTVFTQRSPDML